MELKEWKAHAAVLSANLLFGINFSTVQYITRKLIQPFGLNVIRVAVSMLLLWLLILFSKTNPLIQRKHLPRFILCAITGVVVNQMLFIKGLSMTLSIHASLLILVTPIFITVVAAFIGKEAMTFLKIAGLAAGISGAVLLVMDRTGNQRASNILWGDILIIINAISYAFYFVLVKPLMNEYNPIHVIRWVFTIGFIMVLPIGYSEFSEISWSSMNLIDYSVLTFIVLGGTFLAYLFNLYGINRIGASLTGTYIYTQPVFAAIIAVLVLGEVITYTRIFAAILIVSGVVLAGRKKNPNPLSKPAKTNGSINTESIN